MLDFKLLLFQLGRMLGMVTDPVKKTIWVFSTGAIFQYHVNKETRCSFSFTTKNFLEDVEQSDH
jgi:hypothetical protein